jgi:hypothetical protein
MVNVRFLVDKCKRRPPSAEQPPCLGIPEYVLDKLQQENLYRFFESGYFDTVTLLLENTYWT